MIAAVSPHLDDAALGCGALIAASPGAVVVTALAGGPPPGPGRWEQVTPWDAACGFRPGEDVIAARRAEDREALSHLGATPVWLDFPDAQYGPSPAPEVLRRALVEALAPLRPGLVLAPLGLFHSDHLLVAEAAQGLALEAPWAPLEVRVYEDAVYRSVEGRTEEALARLRGRGITPVPVEVAATEGALARKRRAIGCYRTQLRGLTSPGRLGYEDAFAPERCWRLVA